jgi:hypothetical protein
MSTTLLIYSTPLATEDGLTWTARAAGLPLTSNLWEGWLEFVADDGTVVRSGRETTQPNLTDLEYWATGLTPVYLEGALERALGDRLRPVTPLPPGELVSHAVLDPFAVYAARGESALRRQLAALGPTHLRAIIREYQLVDATMVLETLVVAELVALIMSGVRARLVA